MKPAACSPRPRTRFSTGWTPMIQTRLKKGWRFTRGSRSRATLNWISLDCREMKSRRAGARFFDAVAPLLLSAFGAVGFHAVKVRPGSEEEGFACYCRRSHKASRQAVRGQHLQSPARLDHHGRALLIEKVKPPIG